MINEPWVTLGDFHSILYSIDRINGQEVETRDFLEYVTTNNIKELHSSGWYYSWSNKGLGVGRGRVESIEHWVIMLGWGSIVIFMLST